MEHYQGPDNLSKGNKFTFGKDSDTTLKSFKGLIRNIQINIPILS